MLKLFERKLLNFNWRIKKAKPDLSPTMFSYIDFCVLVCAYDLFKPHSCFKSLSQCCPESQRTPCLTASKVMFCFYSTSLY